MFEGAVVLTRGSLVVYSDRMVVMFRAQDPPASDNQKGPEAVRVPRLRKSLMPCRLCRIVRSTGLRRPDE